MSVESKTNLPGCARADAWLRDRNIEFAVIQQEQATGKCRDSAAERGGNHTRASSPHREEMMMFMTRGGEGLEDQDEYNHLRSLHQGHYTNLHQLVCSVPQFPCARLSSRWYMPAVLRKMFPTCNAFSRAIYRWTKISFRLLLAVLADYSNQMSYFV